MTVPTSIPHQVIADFLQAVGLDPHRVREISIEPGAMTVTLLREDNRGRYAVGGGDDTTWGRPAMESYDIKIEDPR